MRSTKAERRKKKLAERARHQRQLETKTPEMRKGIVASDDGTETNGGSTVSTREIDSVAMRATQLGVTVPDGIVAIPNDFFSTANATELNYVANTLTVKALLREANIELQLVENNSTPIPYIHNRDSTWVAPILFVSASFLSENPHLISVALNVLSNYVTDLFKGGLIKPRVRATFVIEKTSRKTTLRIDYDGPPEQLHTIENTIKRALQ